jgi:hypothetical protein
MIFLQVPNLFFDREILGVETLSVETLEDKYKSKWFVSCLTCKNEQYH